MSPAIQHVVTSDGVAIAYAVSGEGPPIISVPAPPENHLQLEWETPSRRQNVEALGRHRTVVRFDGRGTGLSERAVDDFSLEARLRDLEAVADRVGFERFALISGGHGTQLTVAYAAAHPERVSHLIAVNPFLRGEEFMGRQELDMWRAILSTDYKMFTEAMGARMFGWGSDAAVAFGEYFRQCVDGETAMRIYEAMLGVDLSELVPKVTCPALVIRMDGEATASAPRFAALAPRAQLVLAPGLPHDGGTPVMRVRIGEFFGEDWAADAEPESPGPSAAAARSASANRQGRGERRAVQRAGRGQSRATPPDSASGLRVILFTDLEAHTAIVQRLGDARGRVVLREHERITRQNLRAHGGTEVKAMGDGFMAWFGSAQAALACATAIQRDFAALGERNPDAAALRLRAGINAGEPIAEDGDLFGTSVITASRIATLAGGGEVLVANVVRELVAGKGFLFADRGEHALKGLEEPVRVWQLRLE